METSASNLWRVRLRSCPFQSWRCDSKIECGRPYVRPSVRPSTSISSPGSLRSILHYFGWFDESVTEQPKKGPRWCGECWIQNWISGRKYISSRSLGYQLTPSLTPLFTKIVNTPNRKDIEIRWRKEEEVEKVKKLVVLLRSEDRGTMQNEFREISWEQVFYAPLAGKGTN